MSEADEKLLPSAATEAGDEFADADQQPSLKSSLTGTLQDMEIDSAEVSDNKQEASSKAAHEKDEEKETLIQLQRSGQDVPLTSNTAGKFLDVEDVSDNDNASQQHLQKTDISTGAETSCSKEGIKESEKDNKDIDITDEKSATHGKDSERPSTRRQHQEKEQKDEHQNPRGAKKAKKEKYQDTENEHRQFASRRREPVTPDLSKMHTLEDFGYKFNENGELSQIESGFPFVFEVLPNNRNFNQRHYEALGDVITEYVFELLEKESHLKRVYLPVEATDQDPRSFIFVSDHALEVIDSEDTTDKKLLVLIHGSGVVRAGQWARRLIINNNLDQGTMLPYIEQAKDEGYEVMVLNTNYNSDKGRMIKGNSSPELHGKYVWKNFISKWPNDKVAIVAHSAGGYVTVEMAKQCKGFTEKVFAVGFTDSVHSLGYYTSTHVSKWFKMHSQNWVSSSQPLDTKLGSYSSDCPQVSAGSPKHEETSYYSQKSIFKFFRNKEEEHIFDQDEENAGAEGVLNTPEGLDMSRGLEGGDADNEESGNLKKVQTNNVHKIDAKSSAEDAGQLGRTEATIEPSSANILSGDNDSENSSKGVDTFEEKLEGNNKQEL